MSNNGSLIENMDWSRFHLAEVSSKKICEISRAFFWCLLDISSTKTVQFTDKNVKILTV